MNKFRGIFPAIITPMTAEGGLNEEAFRQVMEFNIQAGVQGFWVAGGTGESILLDDAENRRIAEIAADQSQGRIANIMHVGAPTTERAARLAEHAAKAGVEAICCVPPFFYTQSDKGVVEHYRVVAAAADLPFFVYNLPSATGVEITPELMAKIQEGVPQLAGLKHSAPYIPYVKTFAEMGLSCLIGNARLMLPGLLIGATGCVDGPPNMAPELWAAIWRAYEAGDIEAARAAQEKASSVSEALALPAKFHGVIKAVIGQRLGIDCGDPRPPGEPLTADERAALAKKVVALGLA
ncbi:MAG: dihydrodipicolinate synthase family protein [Caldilineaceae bacterium]|nr:dihydrodipicolinate synthase family protein [Caldilineaceae bacterium]MCY4118822.1 dihydrodipicolinate synthase family protein [Caldilineaceae bacterium]MDE0072353.1 dihydrodipicolinate synthase family protein [Caldilineaceae bacterium]MDE0182743.1 dihydrodipicolinate synthase family protein [Caldilineaceae bacterium]MDE0428833.1 dihydrodipicolinate synthase family protein [Caldilineaceae bacterium]